MKRWIHFVAALILSIATAPSHAATRIVNLPYSTNDARGTAWVIQSGGFLQQRAANGQGVYGQVGMIQINDNGLNSITNQATLDDATGEITLDRFNPIMGVGVTRRILIQRDAELVRYIDIFRNAGGAETTILVQLTTSFNYGVNNARTISDPKRPGQDFGWVGTTARGPVAIEIYAGRSAGKASQIRYEQGNNAVPAMFQLTIPPGKSVAIMHFHGLAPSMEKGEEMVSTFKAGKFITGVPADLQKSIVNFVLNQSIGDDREILRGTVYDVIELRSGDTLNGTLQEKSFAMEALFGAVDLTADKVVGLINVGQFRPRQLLIGSEGEIIGGALKKQTIDLQLGSGQLIQVPLSQISRLGYRQRPGEPEEWKLDKPLVLLQGGDRLNIVLPDEPIDVLIRYGLLKLAPKNIAVIQINGAEHGAHEIQLIDGSHFAGLVSADSLSLKLSSLGSSVKIPVNSITALQFIQTDPNKSKEDAASLALVNGDMLAGVLSGQLKLNTAFDSIGVAGRQIRSMTRSKESLRDVQITLWDQSKLSGQLDEPTLICSLDCGMSVTVPVALIDSYSQPSASPSDQSMQKINSLVAQLNADDWQIRDRAQAELASLGEGVIDVLKPLRAAQSPEAQQRIDAIIKQFDKTRNPLLPGGQ